MENLKVKDWQQASDQSDVASLTADLPTEYPLGGKYIQEVANEPPRVWQRIDIVSGKVAGRWCYWHPWSTKNPHSGLPMPGLGPNPLYQGIADTIFNGDAPHFIGMLGVPYSGKVPGLSTHAWVLVSPRFLPPPEIKQYEDKPRERYERSKEIYDVDTGLATKLPR
jgi:hypothetical protein